MTVGEMWTLDGNSVSLQVMRSPAWGDEAAIRARLDEHVAAGADHVCIQPLHPEAGIGAIDENALRAFAPSGGA